MIPFFNCGTTSDLIEENEDDWDTPNRRPSRMN
jgi:hypothetical protein